ncbi:MAG: PQQ-binding-like beta-propeller repeat protein, partial [Longimicrobiales bacterium]
TGILYVKASNQPSLLTIAKADTARMDADYAFDSSTSRSLTIADGIPIQKPPYGTLTAIDLNTGDHVWQIPIGDTPRVRSNAALSGVELPPRLGVVGAPGPMVTAGGLVFLTGGGTTLYAVDKQTGAVLLELPLGARGYANPMTYQTRSGRQFVVIATGSGDDARLMAFSLPRG